MDLLEMESIRASRFHLRVTSGTTADCTHPASRTTTIPLPTSASATPDTSEMDSYVLRNETAATSRACAILTPSVFPRPADTSASVTRTTSATEAFAALLRGSIPASC
uniref:(northern house mosquito) hypothetical protein n=1 Tax=Culex pipiens TaxID=7175 RepID=A0A8D8NXF4_CULPI